jgi:hypothetical protein
MQEGYSPVLIRHVYPVQHHGMEMDVEIQRIPEATRQGTKHHWDDQKSHRRTSLLCMRVEGTPFGTSL